MLVKIKHSVNVVWDLKLVRWGVDIGCDDPDRVFEASDMRGSYKLRLTTHGYGSQEVYGRGPIYCGRHDVTEVTLDAAIS